MKRYRLLLDLLKNQKAKYLLGILLLGLIDPLNNIVLAGLSVQIFDEAIYDASLVLPVAIKFLLLMGILALLLLFGRYLMDMAALKTTGDLRQAVLSKMLRLDQRELGESHSGDFISRSTNDVQVVERIYRDQLAIVAGILLNGIGCGVAMFILDWRFSLGLIVYQALMLFLVSRFAKPLKKASDALQAALSKVTAKASDIMQGYQVIRLFNAGSYVISQFRQHNEGARQQAQRRVRISALYTGINSFSWTSSFVGFIIVSAFFVQKGYISLGTVIALVQLQNGIGELFLSLGTYYNQLQGSLAGLDRIIELLAKKEEPKFYPLANGNSHAEGALALNNVSFSYDGSTEVVRDLNLSVAKGETVAIVGPSGGGKSTLFKLLLGFNYPQTGGISLLGRPASEYSLKELRNLFAYVPQEPYLFSGTIAENIANGNLKATREEIIIAAEQANAHEFISKLPEGYDTPVGERGVFLSGGEKQRIAIARAVLKNAQILLLDEATSSLDNESEALVQEALENLMQDRTSLVIAHRLSTVEQADRILVMDQGRIVEEGTHASLLATGGLYTRLHQLQFTNNGTENTTTNESLRAVNI